MRLRRHQWDHIGWALVACALFSVIAPSDGAVVFASSTGRQLSEESDDWGNGAFTKALVEGTQGKASYDGSGRVTWQSLSLYVSDRVKALTDGEQTPTTTTPNTVPDFPIALVGGN